MLLLWMLFIYRLDKTDTDKRETNKNPYNPNKLSGPLSIFWVQSRNHDLQGKYRF